jgi:hypothetical protein
MIKLQGKALGQPTQDNRDHMVNKLESGTTVSRSFSQGKYKSPHHKRQEKVKKDLKHIKCFKCSDMGHYAFMCSAQVECKTRLSRRQRRHLRTITCFGYKKEGHKIQACPNSQAEPHCSGKTGQTDIHNRLDRSSNSFVSQVKMKMSSKGPIVSRTRQGLQEQVRGKKRSTCPR